MKYKSIIGIFTFIVLIALAIYGINISAKSNIKGEKFINNYLQLIMEKKYKEAAMYSSVDNKILQHSWESKIQSHGAFTHWEIMKTVAEGNIFNEKKLLRIKVRIYFSNITNFYLIHYLADDSDTKIHITNTYRDGASMLENEVW